MRARKHKMMHTRTHARKHEIMHSHTHRRAPLVIRRERERESESERERERERKREKEREHTYRCAPLVISSIGLYIAINKDGDRSRVAILRCQMQGSPSLEVALLHVGPCHPSRP